MTEQEELTFKTVALARSAPQSWSEFLAAFRSYTDNKRDQCISSPPDSILVTQGRAQLARDLLRLFENCVQDAERIGAKRR